MMSIEFGRRVTSRRGRGVLAAACVLVATACGGSSDPGTDAAAGDAPAVDTVTVTDTGPRGCPAHTHEVSPGVCDATLRFADSTPIPLARDHHGTVLVETPAGPRLFVVGGAALAAGSHDQSITNDVSVAPIQPDGTIGAWTAGRPLPSGRAGQAMVAIGDTLIAVAGQTTGSFLRTTALARVQSDGTLGEWTPGPVVPDGRFHIAGAAYNRWVYVSGGLALRPMATVTGSEARPEVWGAQLGTDGTLGAWQVLTPLPEGISHHVSFVHEGYLFVAGGLGGDPFQGMDVPRRTVYRSRIATDGTLGAWEPVNEVPGPIGTHSYAIHHDRVYLFGGVAGTANSDVIYRAQLLPGGALGAWEQNAVSLPTPRAHLHYAPIRDGRVYLVSGSMQPHTPVPTTWVGTFE
jgi:hypothetical protein